MKKLLLQKSVHAQGQSKCLLPCYAIVSLLLKHGNLILCFNLKQHYKIGDSPNKYLFIMNRYTCHHTWTILLETKIFLQSLLSDMPISHDSFQFFINRVSRCFPDTQMLSDTRLHLQLSFIVY